MKLELKDKWKDMPRNPAGDVAFTYFGQINDMFTTDEIVELVNRALYQLEYQAHAHAKRGREERAKAKLLREQLKASGKDPKALRIKDELEGK